MNFHNLLLDHEAEKEVLREIVSKENVDRNRVVDQEKEEEMTGEMIEETIDAMTVEETIDVTTIEEMIEVHNHPFILKSGMEHLVLNHRKSC